MKKAGGMKTGCETTEKSRLYFSICHVIVFLYILE